MKDNTSNNKIVEYNDILSEVMLVNDVCIMSFLITYSKGKHQRCLGNWLHLPNFLNPTFTYGVTCNHQYE